MLPRGYVFTVVGIAVGVAGLVSLGAMAVSNSYGSAEFGGGFGQVFDSVAVGVNVAGSNRTDNALLLCVLARSRIHRYFEACDAQRHRAELALAERAGAVPSQNRLQ
jgi:hypothetical protein